MNWPTIPPILLSSFKLGAGSHLEQAPDGSEVIIPTVASVDLGITPAQLQAYPPGQSPYVREGTYTLAFEVANFFPKYPGEYDIEIDFGTQKLGEVYGWGKVVFTSVTAIFPGPGYIIIDKEVPGGGQVQSGNNLILTINGSSWQLMMRSFSLTFTPTN